MSIFPNSVHCDMTVNNLPLPVESCVLCTGSEQAWQAAPNGTSCILTWKVMVIEKIPENALLTTTMGEVSISFLETLWIPTV